MGRKIRLRDLFVGPNLPTIVPNSLKVAPASCCTSGAAGNPFVIQVQNLKSGAHAEVSFEIEPPYGKPRYRNWAAIYRAGQNHADWFAKNDGPCATAPPNANVLPQGVLPIGCVRADVQVLGVGQLRVNKEVVNNTPFILPPNAKYDIEVGCTVGDYDLAADFNPAPSPSFGVKKIEAGKGVSFKDVPANAKCTISEPPLADIPSTTSGECGGHGAHWTTTYSSPASSAVDLGSQMTVQVGGNATTKVVVTNTLECKNPSRGSIIIKKELADDFSMTVWDALWNGHPDSPWTGDPLSAFFPVEVNCSGAGSTTNYYLSGPGAEAQTGQLPFGTSCTVTELPPQIWMAPIANNPCEGDHYLAWEAEVQPSATVAAGEPATEVTVTNKAVCKLGTPPPTCELEVDKGAVINADGKVGFTIAVTNVGAQNCPIVRIADAAGAIDIDLTDPANPIMGPQVNFGDQLGQAAG